MAELSRRSECDLTMLSAIAGIVTKENWAEIAEWFGGRSLREVEAFVARRQPERKSRDQVRQIFVMSTKVNTGIRNGTAPTVADTTNADPGGDAECKAHFTFTPSAGSKLLQLIDNKTDENRMIIASSGVESEHSIIVGKNGAETGSERDLNFMQTNTGACGAAAGEPVIVEREFKPRFAVDPGFMEKPNKIKSLLSMKYPKGIAFETLFDILMNEYLERHDPERRTLRRKSRKDRCTDGEIGAGSKKSEKKRNVIGTIRKNERTGGDKCTGFRRIRHIPQSIRNKVFNRDGGRCTFIGNNGVRCNSSWNLEIDHIVPFAKGGENSLDNLRLLCARHNQLEAVSVRKGSHGKILPAGMSHSTRIESAAIDIGERFVDMYSSVA
jgi:5-methylcytosine-specific restriction endonuclease McrA